MRNQDQIPMKTDIITSVANYKSILGRGTLDCFAIICVSSQSVGAFLELKPGIVTWISEYHH
jgi:hypothetical protein